MMAAFEKGEKLRFIGHLDLMRTMQRALRRSHLPIKYSNGFNPHIRLSFAAPLSVGVAGRREMMEVPVEDGTSPAEFIQKLNACLPPDLQIVSAKPVSDEFPTLMSLMAGSEYSVRLPRSAAADQAAELNEDGEAGLLRLTEIWCAMNGVPAIVIFEGGQSELLANVVAQIYAHLLQHPSRDPVGLAVYVELRYMTASLMLGEWFE